jgi:hypothetical protein
MRRAPVCRIGPSIPAPADPSIKSVDSSRSSSVIFGGSLLAMTGLVLRRKASSTNS